MKKILLIAIGIILVLASCSKDKGTTPEIKPDDKEEIVPTENDFVDKDGRIYKTIEINGKLWMAENLAYLPKVNKKDISSNNEACYYVYGYEGGNVNEAKETTNYKDYGVLYNVTAAKTACPAGWHLPSDKEWKELEQSLGMNKNTADKIGLEYKAGFFRGDAEMGYSLMSPDKWNFGIPTNSTGFSALPSGIFDSSFSFVGKVAHFWTSTGKNDQSFFRGLVCFQKGIEGIMRNFADNKYGYSVRYIKGDAEDNIYIPVESLSLESRAIELKIGETAQILCNILPKDATDKGLIFESIGSEIAKVDEDGLITAVGEGLVTIVVSSSDNSQLKITCNVNVIPEKEPSIVPENMIGIWNTSYMTMDFYGTETYEDDVLIDYPSMQGDFDKYRNKYSFNFKDDDTIILTLNDGTSSTNINGILTVKDASKNLYTGTFETEDEDAKVIDFHLLTTKISITPNKGGGINIYFKKAND